jgi:spermidine synthase
MKYNYWSAISIFFISVAVIALQLMIMRALSVTHYYHFSYLVISTALLGFGASGTFLALFFDRFKRNFAFWNQLFLLLLVLSIPVSYAMAQSLPLDTQYLLYSRSQLLLLAAYNLLMFVPFFFGGTAIGFMISYFNSEVPELYAANLVGSGLGGISSLGLMFLFPAYLLPVMITPVALLGMIFFYISVWGGRSRTLHSMMGAGLLITLSALLIDPPYNVDPYKELARFQQLELQQDAELIEERFGPRGQIDVYRSPTFHYTLFAGPQATAMPPRQLALLLDGEVAGAIFSISDPDEAAIMEYTPQSLPYRLLDQPPNVLILGENSGVNVWLALRMGAERVTVVQTNPQIIRLMQYDLAEMGGSVFLDERVTVVNEDPRIYLERSKSEYDLIHFALGETMATGTSGLQGLSEDFLLTTESIARARSLLSADGLLSITRGIQSPPRDNLKIIAMFAKAVSHFSEDDPEQHLLVSRNYLAANTTLSRAPLSDEKISRFKSEAAGLQLDLEYYPGIVTDEIDQLNVIEGPDGTHYSYIHHAVNEILFGDAVAFFDDWAYNLQPPTDNSPYFHDFFRWASLGAFLDTYGEQWFQRLELGYVILVITFIQLSVAAFLLILLPLAFRWRHYANSPGKLPTFLYFFFIGTGFMFIEITLIQTFTRFLGDPIFSAAAILSSILVFSGAGSAIQKKLGMDARKRIRIACGAIIAIMLIYLLLADPLLSFFIGFGTEARFAVTIIMLMPVSFFFGWMFPSGVNILEKESDTLIPWAWGVDGFASVAAAPLAIILSMSIGFSNVILLGMVCYAGAGVVSLLWQPIQP